MLNMPLALQKLLLDHKVAHPAAETLEIELIYNLSGDFRVWQHFLRPGTIHLLKII